MGTHEFLDRARLHITWAMTTALPGIGYWLRGSLRVTGHSGAAEGRVGATGRGIRWVAAQGTIISRLTHSFSKSSEQALYCLLGTRHTRVRGTGQSTDRGSGVCPGDTEDQRRWLIQRGMLGKAFW